MNAHKHSYILYKWIFQNAFMLEIWRSLLFIWAKRHIWYIAPEIYFCHILYYLTYKPAHTWIKNAFFIIESYASVDNQNTVTSPLCSWDVYKRGLEALDQLKLLWYADLLVIHAEIGLEYSLKFYAWLTSALQTFYGLIHAYHDMIFIPQNRSCS